LDLNFIGGIGMLTFQGPGSLFRSRGLIVTAVLCADQRRKGRTQMEKIAFLTAVAEVMKGMISHETMMASIQRSCMRGEEANFELMRREKVPVDALIEGMSVIESLAIPDDTVDVLVLRYLRNTQFLASLKEDAIDISGLGDNGLQYWKKTMLYKPPVDS